MVLKRHPDPRGTTNPIIWCIAIICAILAIVVILAAIAIFIIYMVMKPKVPYLAVSNASLDVFDYSQSGFLTTQVTIFVRWENDNSRASTNFYGNTINLSLGGKVIAYMMLPDIKLVKNSSKELPYVVVSAPIPLRPSLRDLVDRSIKQDRLTLDLDGVIRARWNIWILGSVKFWIDMKCPLEFRISTKESIGSYCKSKMK
ncbi:uncharacterized protein LOC124941083 [Impatiens glandulifera]|uniref:uncharacterized protein LOC124941083 n=1 Tax=Impatiens glandulifera TaxID=253017 RepID=UPI001FB059B4|nr:uncharacterized protein LOC124941083 [Impatiens glandulifera]